MKKLILVAVALLAAALLSWQLLNGGKAIPEETPTPFKIFEPQLVDTLFEETYLAEIQSIRFVEIRARLSGFLKEIHVDEGQAVRQGQVLFTLEPGGLIQQRDKAEALLNVKRAQLKAAKIEETNNRRLFESHVISEPEYLLSKARLEASEAEAAEAAAELEMSNLQLSFLTIRAPFDGVINRIPFKPGSLIEDGSLLTTIADPSAVYAYYRIPEDLYYLNSGDEAKETEAALVLLGGQILSENGQIETSETVVDRNTGKLAYRVKFPNKNGLIRHGSSGKVILKTRGAKGWLIPQKSTLEVQDRLCVYAVDADLSLKLRAIEVKGRIGDYYLVSQGIEPSMNVLFEGHQLVKAGEKLSTAPRKIDYLKRF